MLLKQEYTNHYQKIGFFPVSGLALEEINDTQYTSYIKILYLPENYELTVDFTTYKTRGASLFFIGSDQFLRMDKGGESHGYSCITTGIFIAYRSTMPKWPVTVCFLIISISYP